MRCFAKKKKRQLATRDGTNSSWDVPNNWILSEWILCVHVYTFFVFIYTLIHTGQLVGKNECMER